MKKKIMIALALVLSVILIAPAAEAKKISSIGAAKKLARSRVSGAVVTEVDIDYGTGGLVYEVSLYKGNRQYELDYRAKDGKLIKYEWEITGADTLTTGTRLTKARIKKLARAKVKNGTVTQVTLDIDDGVEEYDVTLKKGKKIYKLTYAADTGKLKDYQWKIANTTTTSTKYIGVAKAKKIAKKKVSGATITKAVFEMDDGVPVYEIEMTKGTREYELTIHAKTGKILEYDVDSIYD